MQLIEDYFHFKVYTTALSDRKAVNCAALLGLR
jgi:hypothetical protein